MSLAPSVPTNNRKQFNKRKEEDKGKTGWHRSHGRASVASHRRREEKVVGGKPNACARVPGRAVWYSEVSPVLLVVVLTPAASRQASSPRVVVRNVVAERALKQDVLLIWPASDRSCCYPQKPALRQASRFLEEQETTFSDPSENYKLSERVSKFWLVI